MNTLTIVGLCLFIPSMIVIIGSIIFDTIEMFKEDIRVGLFFLALIIGWVGMTLLIFAT